MLQSFWFWTKAHDLPNWMAVAFTAVLWPLVLFVWTKRKVNSVRGLEVKLSPGTITIKGNPREAVALDFINHTGSVVYLTAVRFRANSANFPVSSDVSRDIGDGTSALAFLDTSGEFTRRELTLQTNQEARTCIGTRVSMGEHFYRYRSPWSRRPLRRPKFLVLECTVMVGRSRYSVATVH